MSKASNHMVSEASLLGLSEILLKINKDVIVPYINDIIINIIICLHSDSWPIVDSATICSGSLLRYYDLESEKHLFHFLEAWSVSTRSPIWSVRENSSIAFCEALKCTNLVIKQKILKYITDYLDNNLLSAEKEVNLVEKKVDFIPKDMMEIMLENERKILRNIDRENNMKYLKNIKTNNDSDDNNNHNHNMKNESNIIELEDIIKIKQKGTWGCCLDCLEIRKNNPWEASDGCIYLIRELSTTNPEIAFQYLPQIYQLLQLEGYKNSHKLHTNIFNQVNILL